MLSLSKKTDYALIALAYLGQLRAEHVHPETAESDAVSARKIADKFSLPLPLLMNLLKDLVKARIVASIRGASGGYRLAVEPAEVSLLDVVQAIDGPVQLVECSDPLPILGQGCLVERACPIRKPMRRLERKLEAFLSRVTLADLIDSEVDVPVEEVGVEPSLKPRVRDAIAPVQTVGTAAGW